MTTITVCVSDGGMICGFEAAGHAGAKKIRGYDLVCCAVSALPQTGVNALCEVAGVQPDVRVRDGYLSCRLPEDMDEQTQVRAQIVLRTILTGLKDIQNVYPNLIRIQQTGAMPAASPTR